MSRSFEVPDPIPLNQQQGQTFTRLVDLMRRLLAPDGCPWDRKQSLESLKPYVLEEACEVMDAIDSSDPALLQEELGDLMLQVVFLAELSSAKQRFGPDDVVRGICDKLVRRHPHVFGDAEVDTAEDVAQQWEAIKATEKVGPRGLLDRVPRSLPPLERARQLSERAARVGFDWPDADGSRRKVQEELGEVDEAVREGDSAHLEAEVGDLLFALVNFCRHHELDAGRALAGACTSFTQRFSHVESRVQQEHGGWPRDPKGKPTRGVELDALEAYWVEAKSKTGGGPQ